MALTATIYPTRNLLGKRQWRWRIRAANGEILASGEAYQNRSDAEHALKLLLNPAIPAVIANGDNETLR